ncbi:hypothetical protein BY996DRAFT_6577133 [Phakopsora pachyrhizi]|nr:hypothetical protein BY996DRAFT_6577133 [Phakopsora pachyrhizi]
MPEFYYWLKITEENIPRILSTAFSKDWQVVEQSLLLSKSNTSTKWYFVVDKVEAPSKFRRECYETVKIQREVEKHFEVSVTLNQSAIKGRSGSIEAVNESTCNIVKKYLDPSKPTDIEGNLNLSGVRQTTTQDKQLNKEQD